MQTSPVQAIIGLGLDVQGRGFEDAERRLEKQAQGFDRIAQHVEGIGSKLDTVLGKVGLLAGAVGVGGLLSDFVQLENQATRVALAVNNIGGNPYATTSQFLAAGKATSQAPGDLASGVLSIASLPGGVTNPGGVARALGVYSGAYGMQPSALGQQVAQIELFQRQGGQATQGILKQMAAQAAGAGMAGQTPLFTQTVAQSVAALVGAHPAAAGPAVSRNVGALYGAVQSVNPAFRDPSVFGGGLQGVDSALTGAYQNPRMQAVLAMAGVSYGDARSGLAGAHAPQVAQKLLSYADRMYGRGSTAEDIFFRSNFGGNVGADFLEALAKGQGKAQQLLHPGDVSADTLRRFHFYEQSPGAALQRGRSGIEKAFGDLLGGPLGDVLGFAADNPLLAIGGYMGGKRALGFGLRKGAGAIRGAYAARQASLAAEEAAAQAGLGGAGTRAASGAGSLADDLAAARGAGMGDVAGAGIGGLAAGVGLGVAGAYGGLMLFPDSAGLPAKIERAQMGDIESGANSVRSLVGQARKKFGANWFNSPRAQKWLQGQINNINDPARRGKVQKLLDRGVIVPHRELDKALESKGVHKKDLGAAELPGVPDVLFPHHKGAGGGHGGAVDDQKFSNAVDKFARAIGLLTGDPTLSKGAAYHGSSQGMLNAAGLAGTSSMIGSSMILARAIGGAGASGGGGGGLAAMQTAALDGGGPSVGGGGWQDCTLTWYDPALGGTNSSSGKKDPHSKTSSGQRYNPHAMTCAAPPGYDFGTQIAFSYQGQQVTCTVNDRGGAITGNHFDLSRGAAQALGMIDAGKVTAKFKVTGRGRSSSHSHGGGGSGSGGGGPTLYTARAAAAAWLGGGGGGHGSDGHGGGGGTINVNIDGRRMEHFRAVTRGRA